MKFAAVDQRYLSRRAALSEQFGERELWSVIDHWPLYCGIGNLARYVAISDLLRSTLQVPGEVAEFGTWRGATLMLLAKLLRIHDPHGPKVVHCFDTFEGLQAFAPQDGAATDQAGSYRGSLEELEAIIDLYEMSDEIELHKGLIEATLPALVAQRPELTFSFAYCDTDLYESTAAILHHVAPRLSSGGLIVFDEWNSKDFPGEGIAVNEFLAAGGSEFDVLAPSNTRQPSLVLRKRG
jgi:hypothetical protein